MLNKIVETLKQLTTTENIVVGGAVNPECVVFAERYYENISNNKYNEILQGIAQKILINITGKFEAIESCRTENGIMYIILGNVVFMSIEEIQAILGFDDIGINNFYQTFDSLPQTEKDRFIHNILVIDRIKALLLQPFINENL